MSVSEGQPALTPMTTEAILARLAVVVEDAEESRWASVETADLAALLARFEGVLDALAREQEAREAVEDDRYQYAEYAANLEGQVRELREKARYAKMVAAAPDYDEEAIRDALWAVVAEALVGLPERSEP